MRIHGSSAIWFPFALSEYSADAPTASILLQILGLGVSGGQYPFGSSTHAVPHSREITDHPAAVRWSWLW